MESEDISFSDVVPHHFEEDEEPFQYSSQSNYLEAEEIVEGNEQFDSFETDVQQSPSKRTRKYKSEVKKVLSKWILFSGEQRPKISKELPHLPFAEMAREVAERYRNISPEDSERLDAVVAADKERYKRELSEALDDVPVNKTSTALDSNELPSSSLAFPIVRKFPIRLICKCASISWNLIHFLLLKSKVRRACKLDPDVKAINKDAMPLITKAVELFVGFLARKCAYTVSLRGVRQIKDTDVIQTIFMHDSLDFLRVDFPRKPLSAPKPTAPKLRITAPPSSASIFNGGSSGVAPASVGTKSKAGRPSGVAAAPAPLPAGKGIDKFFGTGGAKASTASAVLEGKRGRVDEEVEAELEAQVEASVDARDSNEEGNAYPDNVMEGDNNCADPDNQVEHIDGEEE